MNAAGTQVRLQSKATLSMMPPHSSSSSSTCAGITGMQKRLLKYMGIIEAIAVQQHTYCLGYKGHIEAAGMHMTNVQGM